MTRRQQSSAFAASKRTAKTEGISTERKIKSQTNANHFRHGYGWLWFSHFPTSNPSRGGAEEMEEPLISFPFALALSASATAAGIHKGRQSLMHVFFRASRSEALFHLGCAKEIGNKPIKNRMLCSHNLNLAPRSLMLRSRQNILLHLAGQVDVIGRKSGNANHQIAVVLGVLHGVAQHLG